MSTTTPVSRLPRLTLCLGIATVGLGLLYAVGQTDTLLVLPVISGALTLLLAIMSALVSRGARVVLAWSAGAVFVCVLVVGLLLPAT